MSETLKKTVTSRDGINLYYETYMADGRQPAVFFVHGVGGDIDAWQYFKDQLLQSGISSIAMDIRGHGYSGHPRSLTSYRINNFTDDIATVLEQEKIDTVFLVGHSLGATIALCFALRYPEKLKGLVVIAGSDRPPSYLSSKILTLLSRQIIKILAFFSFPPIYPGHSIYPVGKFHREFDLWGLTKTMIHNSWRSYLLASMEILTLDIEQSLSNIKVPTLIMVGGKDTIFPLAVSKNIHNKIAGSEFKVIAGANHVVVLNNQAEVSALLGNFLEKWKKLV